MTIREPILLPREPPLIGWTPPQPREPILLPREPPYIESILESLEVPDFTVGTTEKKQSHLLTFGIVIIIAYFLLKK